MALTTSGTLKSNEIPVLEFIRKELRSALAEERKSNRALVLREKRRTLGETSNSSDKRCFWNSEEIAKKARELKNEALSTQDYLLLQNSLIQDEANIESFLEADDVLDGLTRDLSRGKPAIKLVAASCCCNIALGNREICDSLAKATGPYLVAELRTLNYPLLEACAWTIGNLSIGSRKAFEILHAQGCLRALIHLSENCDESVVASVLYAVKRCLYSGHDIITEPEVRDLTLAMTRRGNFKHDKESLWILALLSSREASHGQLFPTINTIRHLVSISMDNPNESTVELVTPGIRILGNIVSEPTGTAADTFLDSPRSNEVTVFFEKLLSCPWPNVRKETLWFLGNLYNHAQPRIRARVRAGLSPLLSTLKQLAS